MEKGKSSKEEKRIRKMKYEKKERNLGKEEERDWGKIMEKEMVVLVRTESSKEEREIEFHLVDLERKLIKLNYYPSITNCVGPGVAVLHNCSILIIGGVYSRNPNPRMAAAEKANEKATEKKFLHKDGSMFCRLFDTWEHIEIPSNRVIPNPGGACEKYFCFGHARLCPEMYVPVGLWRKVPLPSNLQGGRCLSFPVLPDPANSRILVHLCDHNELYAFYPSLDPFSRDGHWSLLASDFYTWSHVVAIANDIIYVHHSDSVDIVSSAYHIPSATHLKISKDFRRIGRYLARYETMFTLPDVGLLCLASWIPCQVDKDAAVHFLRFHVQTNIPASELKLTALDYQIYPLPFTSMVDDILLLRGTTVY